MYTLLILDDEALIRQGIKTLVDFQSLSISKVLEAEDGLQGLALLKEHRVDFVLADINMPKLNGLEFAKRAKQETPDLKIALITGYDELDYAVSAIKIGVDDYVLKPVSRTDITDILQNLIDKKKKEQSQSEILQIVQNMSKNEAREASKEEVLQFLKEHLADSSLNLSMVAKSMGFSEGYFSQLFKKWFSITFREYVLHLRLEKSKLLLLSTQLKNYEISAAVGIADPNYFSACFKREYRMTPTEYRLKQGADYAKHS